MTLQKERTLEIERDSNRSHSVRKSLWKKLWTFRATEYRMNKCYLPRLTIKFPSHCSGSNALTLHFAI